MVADNCTDQTATIAHGAYVKDLIRTIEQKATHYSFLFDRIEDDYKRNSFEGFFVFDADNLLMTDYIARMNDAFDSGEKIITSEIQKILMIIGFQRAMRFTGCVQIDLIIFLVRIFIWPLTYKEQAFCSPAKL